jgi:hypothetical protein
MRLLSAKYKTWEGAWKRVKFENSIARFEYEQCYKAHLYCYSVVTEKDAAGKDVHRVARERA